MAVAAKNQGWAGVRLFAAIEQSTALKSELRIPKLEGNPTTENRKGPILKQPLARREGCTFGLRLSSFLRISGFGLLV
jgi:hypothetical protein